MFTRYCRGKLKYRKQNPELYEKYNTFVISVNQGFNPLVVKLMNFRQKRLSYIYPKNPEFHG